MSSQQVDHLHPVVDFAQRLSARLDSLAQVSLLSLPPDDQREVLTQLAKCHSQFDTLQLRLLAQAEQSEATTDSGAATAADRLAIETRQVRREAHSDLRLAERLEETPGAVGGDGSGSGECGPGPRHRGGAGAIAEGR